jgi:hypothetical protein
MSPRHVIPVALLLGAFPALGRAVGLPDDVRCLEPAARAVEPEAPAVALDAVEPGTSDLRLRLADLTPGIPERHPGRMLGFGSALFGIQITSLVLFPPANWSGQGKPQPAQFRHAFTAPPVWNDGDPWTTNYVLHPLMGSLLYTAARRSNYGPVGSFLFATAASTFWEYGIESWFEQPSWPDLLVTSTTGALIGEARWWARQRLLRTGRPGFWGQLGLAFADPIAEAQLLFQSIAGRKAARDLFGDELL